MEIAPQKIEQFKNDGYFILEDVLTPDQLEGLRNECQRYIDTYEREMEDKGVDSIAINHYKKRYFISRRGLESPIISSFLFSDVMAAACQQVLGDNVYLFHEQYVVKAAEVGTKFGWHQDSGYIGHYHKPYLSCWVALDDMTVENGTIYVLPYERAGMQPDDLIEHSIDESSSDKVGYHGSDPGIPAIISAGSIVFFSSRTFHRSGQNTTDRMRRSYLAQYSAEPIMDISGKKFWSQATPLVLHGVKVDEINVDESMINGMEFD